MSLVLVAGMVGGVIMLDAMPIAVANVSASDNAKNCAMSGATAVRGQSVNSTTAQRAYLAAQNKCKEFDATVIADSSFVLNADGTVTLTYVRSVDTNLFKRFDATADITEVRTSATSGPLEL